MPTFVWNTDTYRDPQWTLAELGTSDTSGTPVMTYVTLDSDSVTLAPEILSLVTQGTTTKYQTDVVDKYTVTIQQQVYAESLAQICLPQIVTQVGSDLFRAFYNGDFSNAPLVALRLTQTRVRISDGRHDVFIYVFPKCNVQNYTDIDTFAVAPAIPRQTVTLIAQKTTTDLLGVAIPTLPATAAGGVYFYREIQ